MKFISAVFAQTETTQAHKTLMPASHRFELKSRILVLMSLFIRCTCKLCRVHFLNYKSNRLGHLSHKLSVQKRLKIIADHEQKQMFKSCYQQRKKKFGTLHEFACHPCAGAMLIFSVSFQF